MRDVNGNRTYINKVSSSSGMHDPLYFGSKCELDVFFEVRDIDSVGFDYDLFGVNHQADRVELKTGFCEHQNTQELENSFKEFVA